jgi:hypothetical protein
MKPGQLQTQVQCVRTVANQDGVSSRIPDYMFNPILVNHHHRNLRDDLRQLWAMQLLLVERSIKNTILWLSYAFLVAFDRLETRTVRLNLFVHVIVILVDLTFELQSS